MMANDPSDAADIVRRNDAPLQPNPRRFTPEEVSIDLPDDDDDPTDPLTPADLWF
jgi:hypothetical protein